MTLSFPTRRSSDRAVEKRDAVLRIEVERGREHPDGVRIAALLEGAVAEVIVGPGVVLIERNRLFEVDLGQGVAALIHQHDAAPDIVVGDVWIQPQRDFDVGQRSEEHTSELQSLMRISYAVFCLKKNTTN